MSERAVEGATNPDVAYEASDTDAGALLRWAFWLVMATVVVFLLLWRLYFVFVRQEAARQPPPPVLQADPAKMAPPGPRLQTHPAWDLATYRAEEEAVLNSYGWVDPERGLVRIPIDEAMRLTAERGLPVWTPPPAATPSPAPATGGRK